MTYSPRYRTLTQLFTQSIEQYARKPLFGTRTQGGWQWISFGEFGEQVAAARSGLHALGVGRGDRVAAISNNRLEWAIGAYATYTLGGIYVPMYEAMLDRDWRHILADSGAKLVLTANARIRDRVGAMRPQLKAIEQVVCFEDDSWQKLIERGRQQPLAASAADEQDIAMFIYTSGTTGAPKGVRLSHYNLAANACGVIEVAPLEMDETSLAFLPWAHVFGGCVELNALISHGDRIAICDNTDKLIDYLSEVKPTMLFAVPRIWNRIYDGVNKQIGARPKPIQLLFQRGMELKSKQKRGAVLGLRDSLLVSAADKILFAKVRGRFGGRLRFAFSGAAALATEVAEFIDNLGIAVYEGYGLTETSGAVTANSLKGRRAGSVGRNVPGFEIKLDHDVAGATEGEGEILVYGSGVMQGYHDAPDETALSLTADGGLRTGDLGRIDQDGYLFVTGRVKELYKLSNGKYVAPAPLEEKLQLSPYISQAFIYGSDKPHNTAVIIPDLTTLQPWAESQGLPKQPTELLDDPKTQELIRREIDVQSRDFKGFEHIRGFILDSEQFNTDNDLLTPTFKIKRRNVSTKYAAKLDALYK
jgi:long-chain acyl-CoA synthetase